MTSMDINAVATKIVKNLLPYENSSAQFQKSWIIMPRYSWYILVGEKYTENNESARNIDCSVLHLSMRWGVILFLEICCTIWSKTNNVPLSKRQWNIITEEALLQKITGRQHKSRRKLLLGLQLCHYGLFYAEDNLLQFFSLHDFSKKRGKILLNPRFLD